MHCLRNQNHPEIRTENQLHHPKVVRPAFGAPRNPEAGLPASKSFEDSFSAGLAALGPDTPSLDRLVESADRALYAAKRAGGNQVVELAAQGANGTQDG